MQKKKIVVVRVDYDTWVFLRKHAIKTEKSINKILLTYIEKLKENEKNKLTRRKIEVK